jgi:tetratricopeptide (TPR) repeat protein
MAGLSHPHILPLHDSGEAEGLLFFVMPYVEGETLRQRIDRDTQLDIEDVVRITREVASALDSAHRHGVIHRDIKPENILLGEGGALVADFGIALAVSTASARDASQPGWIVGTPRYMSPEQMLGETSIDNRSDVYSLGVVAYEMLTGQPPLVRPTAPPLHHLRGGIPAGADAVLVKALAPAPGDRYSTAGAFADALHRALILRGTRRRAVLVATGIIALTATVVGTTLVRHQGATSTALQTSTGAAPYGSHQTRNIAAYDLYQRGLDRAFSRHDSAARVAIQYFKGAIAADSTYAAAYAQLAHMYVTYVFAGVSGDSLQEAVANSQAAALKAVDLDDSLSNAHAELGYVRMFVQYDMTSAGTELKRAVALDPTSGRAHDYLQYLYLWTERPDEAVAEARRATQLDPLSVENSAGLAGALVGDRRYDEALALIAKLREVRPPLSRLYDLTAHVDMAKGMWPEAIAEYGGKDAEASGFLGRALAMAGDRADARRMLRELIGDEQREGGLAFDVALVYEGLGDYDNAIAWLDKSIDEHSLILQIMLPPYERLRADPRFERIRRRLNGGGV